MSESIGQLFDRLPRGQWTALPEYGVQVRAWPEEETLQVLPEDRTPPPQVRIVLDEDSISGRYYRLVDDDIDEEAAVHVVDAHLWQAYQVAVDARNIAYINLSRHISGRDPT